MGLRPARLAAAAALPAASAGLGVPGPVEGQSVGEVFRKVTPSVVVIKARGREVTGGRESRFTETGAGVLISADGQIMTAAHVVHAMDEITVEFMGGQTSAAKIIASEPGADLSPGAQPAWMANSDTVKVGDQVIVAELFQTDAVINTGDSGGFVVTLRPGAAGWHTVGHHRRRGAHRRRRHHRP